jgi:Domain of unknown function (DUF4266)
MPIASYLRDSAIRPGLIALGLIALLSSACTHVAPYERSALAHPTMAAALDGPATAHVRAVHEGATGGGSVAESGCGCN